MNLLKLNFKKNNNQCPVEGGSERREKANIEYSIKFHFWKLFAVKEIAE